MDLVCLHGYLGAPSSFDFLAEKYNVFALNIDDYIDSSEEDILQALEVERKPLLIGYSFGARLAMRLFLKEPNSFSGLLLLAGHAGLVLEEEIDKREAVERSFLKKIDRLEDKDYLSYWNGLDLFKFDRKLKIDIPSKKIRKKYFNKWGLSKQPYLLDQLKNYRDKIQWVFGEEDSKYTSYANKSLLDFNVCFIKGAGHRVIDHHLYILNKIEEFNKCLK